MEQYKDHELKIYRAVKARWDSLAKPLDGMGTLEVLVCRLGAIQETTDVKIQKRCVVVMCADNGIVEEGISQSGQEVTYSVADWLGRGVSTVCNMAKAANADVIPVDVGINADGAPEGVWDYKVAKGTRNFLKEPAMTKEQCQKAIDAGIDVVRRLKEAGYQMIASGEMGIGNTTTSAALCEILLGDEERRFIGRGAGLDDKKLEKKKQVVQKAVEQYPSKDAFEALCAVGGFDIAAMAGLFIGGAKYRIPAVIDGAISAISAVCAEMIAPGSKICMIPSHIGREPATEAALRYLGLDKQAVVRADLALGEATGAVLMFPLLDMALALYHNGQCFTDTTVEQYERFNK